MKASLNNYRQSPRKVRLVAKSVKGKRVDIALSILDFMPKRAALPLRKLIESAVANAKMNKDELFVKVIEVNKGITLKRSRPRARGSVFPINKRTSHVLVTLETKNAPKKEEVKAPEVKTSAKPVKKTPVKKVAKKKVVTKEK